VKLAGLELNRSKRRAQAKLMASLLTRNAMEAQYKLPPGCLDVPVPGKNHRTWMKYRRVPTPPQVAP
jgi:hypothetical protein